MRAAFAAVAIAVFGRIYAERVCPHMSHLTQKIDGRFGIAILEFAVRRAHAAQGLDPATVADGRALALLIADFEHPAVPTFEKSSVTQGIALFVRKNAN